MLGESATVVSEVPRTESMQGDVQACGLFSQLLEDSREIKGDPRL